MNILGKLTMFLISLMLLTISIFPMLKKMMEANMSVMHMQMEKPFPELFGCLSQVLLHCCNLSCSIRCLLKWFCKNINFLIQKHKQGFGGHRHLWLQNLNIFGDGATFFIFGKHEGMPAASIISTIEGMLGYYPSIPNLLSCVMNVM